MKIIFALIFSLAITASASVNATKTYSLMTYENASKTEVYKEGTELVESILKASGLKVNTMEAPIMRGLQQVNSLNADFFLAASTSVQKDFKHLIHPPTPFVKTRVFIFYNKNSDGFKNGVPLENLQGVILLNAFFLVRDSVQWLKLSGVSTVEQGLQMVLSNRADYTLADKHLIQEVIDRAPGKYRDIVMVEKPLFDMELYLWTNRRNRPLLSVIERKQKEILLSNEINKYTHLKPLLNRNP